MRRRKRVPFAGVAVLSAAALAGFLGANAIWGEDQTWDPIPSTAPYVASQPAQQPDWIALSISDESMPLSGAPATTPSVTPSTTPAQTSSATPVNTAGTVSKNAGKGRFVVEGVGLDAPLRSQDWSAVIDPPSLVDAWESKGEGWGGKDQPRLITLHSCSHSTACVGNALTQGGKPQIGVGDQIEVDGVQYRVEFVETRAKDQIGSSPVWDRLAASSLISITCSPDGSSRAVENTLFRAERVGGK